MHYFMVIMERECEWVNDEDLIKKAADLSINNDINWAEFCGIFNINFESHLNNEYLTLELFLRDCLGEPQKENRLKCTIEWQLGSEHVLHLVWNPKAKVSDGTLRVFRKKTVEGRQPTLF